MTPDPDKSVAAFRAVVEALLDFPEELRVDEVRGDGFRRFVANWAAEADQGKMIGRMGTHMHALELVAHTVGERIGERWEFKAFFPPRDRPRPPGEKPRRPETHDPKPDLAVLGAALGAMLAQRPVLGIFPEREPGDHVFKITPMTHLDGAALCQPNLFHNRETTLVAELGTLFRAIGGRQGVNYRVEVV